MQHDQLVKSGRLGFQEADIKFDPTYKFDLGTNSYDSSKKQRVPSWCDRVLYMGNVQNLTYGSETSFVNSDHKPVYADFRIMVESNKFQPESTSQVVEGNLLDL